MAISHSLEVTSPTTPSEGLPLPVADCAWMATRHGLRGGVSGCHKPRHGDNGHDMDREKATPVLAVVTLRRWSAARLGSQCRLATSPPQARVFLGSGAWRLQLIMSRIAPRERRSRRSKRTWPKRRMQGRGGRQLNGQSGAEAKPACNPALELRLNRVIPTRRQPAANPAGAHAQEGG